MNIRTKAQEIKAVPACFVIKGKKINRKLSPLVEESVSEADERGKCEQTRKNKK